MIPVEQADGYQQCIFPWIYDRIEVTGSRFIDPVAATDYVAGFDHPREPVAFSLLGTFHCEYESGPNLLVLAHKVAEIVGGGGFYGMKSGRRLNPM